MEGKVVDIIFPVCSFAFMKSDMLEVLETNKC